MLKKLIFLPIIFIFLLIISYKSQADVSVDSSDSNTAENFTPFTSATVPTGTGQASDYQLIVCSVNGNDNFFSPPSPGTWTEHDNASCGIGFSSEECTHGIWGRFTTNPASEDITCSWPNGTNNFTAGSFRYSNVDTINPVINIACNIGFDIEATAPSIMTEAGSQVARIYTYAIFNFIPPPLTGNVSNATTDSFLAEVSFDLENILSTFGETSLFLAAGATGEETLFIGLEAAWRACTIAIRMAGPMQETLTLNKTGNGTGTVTDPSNEIDCDAACNSDTGDFDLNTMVTLTAAPAADSNFGGWGGDCSAAGLNLMATVTMDQARTCEADFELMAPPTSPPTEGPIPPDEITSIPTLSQWGHLSLAILAVLIGVWFLRRHRVRT